MAPTSARPLIAGPGTAGSVPILGQTGVKGLIVYTPWQRRQALSAGFRCDVVKRTNDSTLDIIVQHKAESETDASATTAGTFTQITAEGPAFKAVSGLKELWRLKLTFDEGSSSAVLHWTHVQLLDPIWSSD